MSHSVDNADILDSSHVASRPAATGRPVKACKACRVTKIKCKMPGGAPPCERCTSRGIECERSIEVTSTDMSRSPELLTGDVYQLQTAVNVLLRMSGLPLLSSYSPSHQGTIEVSTPQRPDSDNEGDESWPAAPIRTPLAKEDNNPYALPVSSLYEVTRLPSLRDPSQGASPGSSRSTSDFIFRGVLTLPTAQDLFRQFTTRLDFFCYGIMCPHDNLESLRSSSPLLTAAVCTVAALHNPDGSAIFKACHSEFLKLISAGMFSISYSVDDIRALVIGCWWLGNISYTLLGHAIRTATRLNYHQAYHAVVSHAAREEDITKARLWYVLYVMDQHSSVLYGKPALLSPMEEPHSQWEIFIKETGFCEIDLRISSQVALYHVLAKANNIFGTYPMRAVPEHAFPQLQNTFSEVDRWYLVWGNRMPRNAHVGWFPRDGAILNYQFARLHLCSYVFRGASPESIAVSSPKTREYASIAVASASSILQLVLEREDLRMALVGMPIYFHGMTNFAAVFLIKAIRNTFWGLLSIDVSPLYALVQSYVNELKSQNAARQHLVYHISSGLEDMMQGLLRMPTNGDYAGQSSSEPLPQFDPVSHDTAMFSIDTFNLLQGSIGMDL